MDIGSSESFLHGGELPTLVLQSMGHAVHIFVNGQLSGELSIRVLIGSFITLIGLMKMVTLINLINLGSAFGTRENRRIRYIGKVNLHAGTNRIALLSVAVGLPVSSPVTSR